jgi:Ca2+:H+ antiporter
MYYPEQTFISQGAVAFIAMLGVSGLALLMPQFFGDDAAEDLTISRIGAVLLILLYLQLMYFQLSSHSHLFEGEDDTVALIPFSWALIGMVVVTAMVTILSEWLVGSIDGFCIEFNLSHSFVGVIILPVVGNAVEHISAVSVAMKNKMDLALGGKFLSLSIRHIAVYHTHTDRHMLLFTLYEQLHLAPPSRLLSSFCLRLLLSVGLLAGICR